MNKQNQTVKRKCARIFFVLVITTSIINICYYMLPGTYARKLKHAIREGDVWEVGRLAEQGGEIDSSQFYRLFEVSSDYPFDVACEEGNLEIIKILIENGADIHREGELPFLITISWDHPNRYENAKYFLNHGTDITHFRSPPINYLATTDASAKRKAEDVKILRLLVDYGYDVKKPVKAEASWATDQIHQSLILRELSSYDHIPLLKYLLEEQGYDINLQDEKTGETVLIFAIQDQNVEMVKYLLSQGADATIPTKTWKTDYSDREPEEQELHVSKSPLEIAQETKNREIIQLIEDAASK